MCTAVYHKFIDSWLIFNRIRANCNGTYVDHCGQPMFPYKWEVIKGLLLEKLLEHLLNK